MCWEDALESGSSLKGVCRPLHRTQVTKQGRCRGQGVSNAEGEERRSVPDRKNLHGGAGVPPDKGEKGPHRRAMASVYPTNKRKGKQKQTVKTGQRAKERLKEPTVQTPGVQRTVSTDQTFAVLTGHETSPRVSIPGSKGRL